MTGFSQLKQADGTVVEFESPPPEPVERPSRWSLTNWPVRWKVLAIVLVPLISAGAFGGSRIHSSATAAVDFFEARNLPFLIAINEFDGAPRHPTQGGTPGVGLA